MKNFIVSAIMSVMMLNLTSCDTYVQSVVCDDGFVYEYSYNTYPVRYVDGVFYYYAFVGNIWRWILLDRMYYSRIIHHSRPMRYVYPRHVYRPHAFAPNGRHHGSYYRRPTMNYRPSVNRPGSHGNVRPNANPKHNRPGGKFGR